MDSHEAEKAYEALRTYCCLDTLAMMKIYEFLTKLVLAANKTTQRSKSSAALAAGSAAPSG
jgi:hypothetical protein